MLTALAKLKVMNDHTEQVVISQKRCKIETLLLRTTNSPRK